MTKTILELRKIYKRFSPAVSGEAQGRHTALSNINLMLSKGEIYGFAGLNGAGKTTSIKIAMGLVMPDSGSVELFGKPPNADSFRRTGFCPESPIFYETLTASETLRFSAGLLNVKINDEQYIKVLKKTGLYEDRNKRVGAYSKGMQQRLGIACAILHDPDLYIFDEPASGLDPMGRRMIKEIFKELKSAGKTIFFSTHIIPDIINLCDRIAVIHCGSTLFEGKVADFCSNPLNGEDRFIKMIEESEQKKQIVG